jgi:cell division protein FtsB
MNLIKKLIGWTIAIVLAVAVAYFLDGYMNSIEHLKIVIAVLIVYVLSLNYERSQLEKKIDELDDKLNDILDEISDFQTRVMVLEDEVKE